MAPPQAAEAAARAPATTTTASATPPSPSPILGRVRRHHGGATVGLPT